MAEVRANWFKLMVGSAKRQPSPRREQILGAISDELRTHIRSTSPLAWMPAQEFADLAKIVVDAVGFEGAKEYWTMVMLDGLERPLLRPLRHGAMSIFGHHPGSLLRLTPQAFSLVTHGCADISVDISGATEEPWEGECTLGFENLCPEFSDPAIFEPLWLGGPLSAVTVLKHVGEAESVKGEGKGFYTRIRWRDPGRPVKN